VWSTSELRIVDDHDITPHYVTTLRRWRHNFRGNLGKIRELGYSESFIRMWEFYLGYCEGGFSERTIGDVQLLLRKPVQTASSAV